LLQLVSILGIQIEAPNPSVLTASVAEFISVK